MRRVSCNEEFANTLFVEWCNIKFEALYAALPTSFRVLGCVGTFGKIFIEPLHQPGGADDVRCFVFSGLQDVIVFATSKEQIRKMMCDFKKATEKVGLRIHPDKTKILSNQSTINSDTKKLIEVGDMSIEILSRNESVKYLGQRISFYQQETTEIRSRIRAAWATFHKYRQKLTSKKLHAQTSSTAFRRHSFSDYLLRSGNMGTEQRSRKNDSIDTTQDATTHYPDKKEIQID